MLYWEFGRQVAVRYGKWKAVRTERKANLLWELFDLESDISESTPVGKTKDNREILSKMQVFAKASHEPVKPGAYHDKERIRHQKDRQAKWGSVGPPKSPKKRSRSKKRP